MVYKLNLQLFADDNTPDDESKDEKEDTPQWANQIMKTLEKLVPNQEQKQEKTPPPEVETKKDQTQEVKVPPIKAPQAPETNQTDSTKSESSEQTKEKPKSFLKWFLG